MATFIDQSLLDAASDAARQSPRQRRNHNFHGDNADPCHRLLNAIEPGSYVAPHCHRAAEKAETILVLRGRLGVVLFDAAGQVTAQAVLTPSGQTVGIDLPPGQFHTVIALEPGTVFFESKAGPYLPLAPDEQAPWAPREGEPGAAAYLAALSARLGT
jgi:cupin fold WbuC family metalloprotein